MTKLQNKDVKAIRNIVKEQYGLLGWTIDKYLASIVDAKQSTVDLYDAQLQYAIQFFGADTPMDSITLFDVEAYQKYILTSHKPSTTINIMKTLKRLFTYAYRHDIVATNVFDKFVFVKDKDTGVKYIPTLAEVKKLMQTAYSLANSLETLKYSIVLDTILTTGNRLQETLLVEWKDIDTENLVITLTKDNTKTSKECQKVIDQTLLDKLLMLKKYSNCSYVFSTRNCQPIKKQHVQRFLKKVLAEANIMSPVTCHSLRRFIISDYVAKTGNVEYASKQLANHASIATTERYYLEPDTTNMKDDVRKHLATKSW